MPHATTPPTPNPDREFLTTTELATLLHVCPATLHHWRRRGKGPRWYRVGEKLIRYPRTGVEEWLNLSPAPHTGA